MIAAIDNARRASCRFATDGPMGLRFEALLIWLAIARGTHKSANRG